MAQDAHPYIYADNAATTPLSPVALDAMMPYLTSEFGNPSGIHRVASTAARALADAREHMAALLGAAHPEEMYFTSGGSESDNWILRGAVRRFRDINGSNVTPRVITSAIEHHAILHCCEALEREGVDVTYLPVDACGRVQPADLEQALAHNENAAGMDSGATALVSIMLANNETGVVQPIEDLARAAHSCGALFHTDAVQGWLHIPLDVQRLGVDALSVAGHKVGGPVGIGALYLKNRTQLAPLFHGGGQERGLRPGTQDLRAILGFAAAARTVHASLERDPALLLELSRALYGRLASSARIHATMGDPAAVDRLPGIVSVYVDGIESEELILKLDVAGFEVSAASACSSGSMDASHVLTAMGIPRERALGSLRISFDDRVDPADLDRFADALLKIAG